MRAGVLVGAVHPDAAISQHGRRPCPRTRIQAIIGTVMTTAMPSSTTAGASTWSSDVLAASARSAPSAGSPRATMPRNMAITISP